MSSNDEVSSDEWDSEDDEDDEEYSYDDESESSEEEEALSAEDRLFQAVERNDADADAEAIEQAIRDGANVNAVRNGWTPLLKACRLGNDQIIRILLDAGADARWRDSIGSSAIWCACHCGHLSTAQLLINYDNGLLEKTNSTGLTPLLWAIRAHHSYIVRFLLDCGADAHFVDRRGVPALMHGCQEGSNIEIVRLLLDAGVDVEGRDSMQQTALHKAAYYGEIEVMRELILQHNANMFAVNKYGSTPFDLACVSRRDASIDRLLETYSTKLTENHGRLALHELLKIAQYTFVEERHLFHPPLNPLRINLPLGKLTLMHLRTLLRNLDPELIRNRDDTGKLPIHIACQTHAPVGVLALISELDPAVLGVADFAGALPIHLLCGNATAATEYASVRYLVKSFPGSVAVRTNAGDYPFMVAASDSSLASLSVVYELVRADPGLIKGMPTNPA